MHKTSMRIIQSGIIIGLALSMFGCGDDGSSGDSIGTSTIEGNIDSFSGIQFSAVTPPTRTERIAQLLDAIGDLFVTSVYADSNSGGVAVHLEGTDLSTVTDDRGHFVMSGVPEGQHRLRFSHQDHNASLGLYCPSNSYIQLENMHLQNDSHMDLSMPQEFMERGGSGTWDQMSFTPGGGHVGQGTRMEMNQAVHMAPSQSTEQQDGQATMDDMIYTPGQGSGGPGSQMNQNQYEHMGGGMR